MRSAGRAERRSGMGRRHALAVAVGLTAMSACTHTYIYGESAPPLLDRGKLVVPKRSGRDTFSIRRIGVNSVDDPFSFRVPTDDELAELRTGSMPEGVASLRVEVDNAGVLWRDWGLTAFGIGASLVLAGVGLAGAVEPAGQEFGLTMPLTILLASLAGAEFMLVGVGLGAGFESGETDMRFRNFVDD